MNAPSASSSASRDSRSRWFVGSSRISTLAPLLTRIASESRRRSPPESPASGFSACSPPNRKRPSSARARFGVRPVARWVASSTRAARRRARRRAGRGSRSGRCGRCAACPPASGRRPASVSISVVLPEPFGPTSETCSPRSSHSSACSSSTIGGSPTSIRASSSSKMTRPLRSGASKLNDSAAPSLGARSIRSIFSSALARDCAWRARVPAPQRATNRSSRAISACWRSIARPSASSRAACSARQACQRAGEEARAPRLELEHRRADRLQEPAVVGDEHDRRVERDQRLLEPLERLDVEVVGRLVEQQQVGAASRAPAPARRASARRRRSVARPRSRSSSWKPRPRAISVARSRQR